MRDVSSGVLLLALGSLVFLTGCSARVWRRGESRQRILAIIVGAAFIVWGIAALLGYTEIRD